MAPSVTTRRRHPSPSLSPGISLGARTTGPVVECPPPPPRVVHERVYVEPVYRTVAERKWVEPVYRTVTDRVWVEPVVKQIPECDVITLHSPLTPETQGLMGPAQFAQLPKGAVVINVGRARIVDKIVERQETLREVKTLRRQLREHGAFGPMIGNSPVVCRRVWDGLQGRL